MAWACLGRVLPRANKGKVEIEDIAMPNPRFCSSLKVFKMFRVEYINGMVINGKAKAP